MLRQPIRLCVHALEERAVPAVLLVDDDHAQSPNAKYTSIQAAVSAAHSGDTVRVYAGTYAEQVVVPGTINGLDLETAGRGVVSIAPTNFTADASEAIIHVAGAKNVEIDGFTISGAAAPVGNGNGANYGVLVDGGGSATVAGNRIIAIRDRTLSGTQDGVAIQFGRSNGTAVISGGRGAAFGNSIEDYQKTGIVVMGAASYARVAGNAVRGAGATGVIAQNGIQVSSGAKAEVIGNAVSGNKYTGTSTEAAGILVFNTANVRVTCNIVTGNDEGIWLYGSDSITVADNIVSRNVKNGIALFDGDGSRIVNNAVTQNGLDGINVDQAVGTVLEDNLAALNGRYGIALETAATGSVLRRNHFLANVLGGLFDAP